VNSIFGGVNSTFGGVDGAGSGHDDGSTARGAAGGEAGSAAGSAAGSGGASGGGTGGAGGRMSYRMGGARLPFHMIDSFAYLHDATRPRLGGGTGRREAEAERGEGVEGGSRASRSTPLFND
jgi:hypothetical protein